MNSWGGLSGLIAHINDTILIDKPDLNDEVLAEIVSKYPLSKSSLKYLFTLYDEMISVISELESEIRSLKAQIKPSNPKEEVSNTQDTMMLQNDLRRLENEKNELFLRVKSLELERDELEEQLQALELELHNCRSFFDSNSFCAMLYRNYLRKISK